MRGKKIREVRPKVQKQARAQGNNTHSRNTHKQLSNNHYKHRRYFRYQERLILTVFGGSSTKTIELVLIHPRGQVDHSRWLLHFLVSGYNWNLMAVIGEAAVWLNYRCRVGKCRFLGLLILHHIDVRSSEGSLKFSICGNVSWQA
jgi:hypothetical protein